MKKLVWCLFLGVISTAWTGSPASAQKNEELAREMGEAVTTFVKVLTPEQRQAVRQRDWLRMLELGGNIYYTFKLAACDGLTFQQLAAKQTGVSEDEYVAMMVGGGRSIDGNRSRAGSTGGSDSHG